MIRGWSANGAATGGVDAEKPAIYRERHEVTRRTLKIHPLV